MDSKLRKITIICVILMIIVIAGTSGVAIYLSQNQSENGIVENGTIGASAETGQDLTAFLQDDTFFDAKDNSYRDVLAKGDSKKLSLSAVSVEKDIRVQVLNGLGQLISGQRFGVKLQDGSTYYDEDKDGVIYISGLKAGEYKLLLEAEGGYQVPESPLSVRVKNKVEYTEIADISLLIKTEDEIDAEKEDTEVNDANKDADRSEDKGIKKLDENAHFGIDVSKWNKEIDWEKAKAAGVDFAIIRCGYRGASTGVLVEDPYFKKNIEAANNAGVSVGVYFFTQAVNPVEAVEEASMVISLCQSAQVAYPVFIDTEGAGGNGRADNLDMATRTAVCEAFCKTMKNAGYKAGVYGSKNWFNQNLNMKQLQEYQTWLAEYRESPTYEGEYQMWQYTSKGKLDGIEGNVDFDISYP